MEEEMSLYDIWKLVFRKRIVAYISFGSITLFVLVFILFFYNPMNVRYEAEFSYQWIGIEDNKYANGAIFNFYDIISLEHLEQVKSSDERYYNVDIESIAKNSTIRYKDHIYTLQIYSKQFENDEIAKAFIEDLIWLPYAKAQTLEFDFNANLIGYERAKKITTKLEYLEKQLDLVLKGYQQMISYFGDIQIQKGYLSSLYQNANVFAANDLLDHYKYLAYQNAYMTKEEYLSIVTEENSLKTEQELLRSRKEILLESLKNIYSNSNGNTYMDTSIANYLNSLHALDSRLMRIDEDLRLMGQATLGKYSETESTKFIHTMDAYKENLKGITDEYTIAVQEVLRENTLLHYHRLKIVGRISFVLATLGSLLIGIILSMVIAFIWGYIENFFERRKGLA